MLTKKISNLRSDQKPKLLIKKSRIGFLNKALRLNLLNMYSSPVVDPKPLFTGQEPVTNYI